MNANRIHKLTLAAISLVLAASLPAGAGLTTMHSATATTGVGNQVYYGVGLTFEVTAPSGIAVSDLGVYDSGGNGIEGSATALKAVLYQGAPQAGVTKLVDLTKLVEETFTMSDPGVYDPASGYLFKNLAASLVLDPGVYTIVGYGWNDLNKEHNNNNAPKDGWPTFDGGGLITFEQSVWISGSGATFSTGTPDYFDAANMRFTHAPLPGAVLLGFLGLGAAGMKLRRLV